MIPTKQSSARDSPSRASTLTFAFTFALPRNDGPFASTTNLRPGRQRAPPRGCHAACTVRSGGAKEVATFSSAAPPGEGRTSRPRKGLHP